MKKFILLLFISIITISYTQAQRVTDTVISISQFSVDYGFHLPAADLSKRFGVASTIGLSFNYKTDQNWMFGVHGGYLFGGNVNEPNHMDLISTSDGEIIDIGGIIASVNTSERGGIFNVSFGKIIPTNSLSPNSGILIKISPGYMYHKILIETDENNSPQIMGEYTKGYDRLSAGFQVEEFIGFIHYDRNNLYNFYGGFEFRQGFTKNLRVWDFDLMSADHSNHLDLMFGIKIGWIVPMKKKEDTTKEIIFY